MFPDTRFFWDPDRCGQQEFLLKCIPASLDGMPETRYVVPVDASSLSYKKKVSELIKTRDYFTENIWQGP